MELEKKVDTGVKIISAVLWAVVLIGLAQFIFQIYHVNTLGKSQLGPKIDQMSEPDGGQDLPLRENNSEIIKIWKNRYTPEQKPVYNLSELDNESFDIFLVGGSSTVHPPGKKEKFSYFVEKNLNSSIEREVKVYNLGKSGLTTKTLVSYVRGLKNLTEPDLILLYSGHNDFIFPHRRVLRRKSKVFLGRNILHYFLKGTSVFLSEKKYDKITSHLTPDLLYRLRNIGLIGENLDRNIRYTNRKVLENYRENTEKIIEIGKEENISVMFSTVISNLEIKPKGLPPTTEDERFYRYKEKGTELYKEKNYDKSLTQLKKANKIYNQSAEVHYYLGKIYREINETERSFEHLIKAKDLDNFYYDVRVKSSLNDYLRQINRKGVYTVDLEKELMDRNVRMGDEYFSDLLHPNIKMNRKIGSIMADYIEERMEKFEG